MQNYRYVTHVDLFLPCATLCPTLCPTLCHTPSGTLCLPGVPCPTKVRTATHMVHVSPSRQLQSQGVEQADALEAYPGNWRQAAFAQFGGPSNTAPLGPADAPGPGRFSCSLVLLFFFDAPGPNSPLFLRYRPFSFDALNAVQCPAIFGAMCPSSFSVPFLFCFVTVKRTQHMRGHGLPSSGTWFIPQCRSFCL